MPVGTYGAVKGLTPDELVEVGSQIILGNAYHLGHRPGHETIARWGGLHKMMDWDRPILTDSGGYQVFSLRGLQRIDEGGVDYQTHFDGSRSRMTPQSVLQVQANLGSDICMILDHCPPGDAKPEVVLDAMRRTTKWAQEAADLRRSILSPSQLCFGIVQGGCNLTLREQHISQLRELDFDGFALGGLSVGEPIPLMHQTIGAAAVMLPAEKPRYVMGVGTPFDLLVAVSSGIDMFDCVMPTRHARNGQMFTWRGKINIRKACFRDDLAPVDASCSCLTCRRFTRAYLRHLHSQNDPLYVRLATLHNLAFYHAWVREQREAILNGSFLERKAELRAIVDEFYVPPAGSRPSPKWSKESAASGGGAAAESSQEAVSSTPAELSASGEMPSDFGESEA